MIPIYIPDAGFTRCTCVILRTFSRKTEEGSSIALKFIYLTNIIHSMKVIMIKTWLKIVASSVLQTIIIIELCKF